MQRFSQQIPWVLVDARGNGVFDLYCEICGDGRLQRGAAVASTFAEAHRVHRAPQGSLRLGDAFAAVAKPVARAFGADPNCAPCEARRRAMNQWGS
jgi:hypothetical protein